MLPRTCPSTVGHGTSCVPYLAKPTVLVQLSGTYQMYNAHPHYRYTEVMHYVHYKHYSYELIDVTKSKSRQPEPC